MPRTPGPAALALGLLLAALAPPAAPAAEARPSAPSSAAAPPAAPPALWSGQAAAPWAAPPGLVAQLDEEEGPDEAPEGKKKKKKRKKMKDRLDWDGSLKVAFRVARNRSRTEENQFGFELSDLTLKAKFRVAEDLDVRARVELTPEDVELEEAYARHDDPDALLDRVDLGLRRRFYELDSALETHGLNKIAAYQMRDSGVIARSRPYGGARLHLSLMNGGRLETADISPRRVSKQDVVLADRRDGRGAFGTSSRELGVGLGWGGALGPFHAVEALGFVTSQALSDDDAEDLEAIGDVPGYTGLSEGNSENSKTGANLGFRFGAVEAQTQALRATTRELVRDLITTEWSYAWTGARAVAAFSQQRLSVDPDPLFPVSWERRRYTLGWATDWAENATLSAEATHNAEDTGADPINNDELLVAWIYNF